MPYQVTAPLVIVPDEAGQSHHFYAGTVLPSGLDEKRVKQLAKEGMVEKVVEAEPEPQAPAADTIEAVLAEVGDDKAKAAEALEQEKAGKNRSTLVKQLEAIVNG